jgi:alkaline phosphatase D
VCSSDLILPTHEILALADYRLRYASYRADPDLQRLHQLLPMLVSMDDHESANNSWDGGAQNHQANEGDWSIRKAAAFQAFREWMPVSDEPWKAYSLGGLATIYRTDTRLVGRSRGPEVTKEMQADPAAMAAFRDGAWRDPAATMMGTTQEVWLADAMAASVKAGTRWQLVGFGTNMGFQKTPADALTWLPASAPDWARTGIAERVALGRAGLPQELDNWGGYPAARARFLQGVQDMGADTVLISGDCHNAWAYELAEGGKPAAVEFGGQAVSSGGIEGATRGVDPTKIARSLVAGNPELKWCDTSRRGYMALTLEPETVTNEWVFMDTIQRKSTATSKSHKATVRRGTNRMAV